MLASHKLRLDHINNWLEKIVELSECRDAQLPDVQKKFKKVARGTGCIYALWVLWLFIS